MYKDPKVIFLDYQLGDVNGLEILKKIKAVNPDTFVFFMSGQDKIEIAVNALKFGAIDYIIKNDDAKDKIIKSYNLNEYSSANTKV